MTTNTKQQDLVGLVTRSQTVKVNYILSSFIVIIFDLLYFFKLSGIFEDISITSLCCLSLLDVLYYAKLFEISTMFEM